MMRVNKIMMALGIFLFCGNLGAQELRTEVFDLLDLTSPGLKKSGLRMRGETMRLRLRTFSNTTVAGKESALRKSGTSKK